MKVIQNRVNHQLLTKQGEDPTQRPDQQREPHTATVYQDPLWSDEDPTAHHRADDEAHGGQQADLSPKVHHLLFCLLFLIILFLHLCHVHFSVAVDPSQTDHTLVSLILIHPHCISSCKLKFLPLFVLLIVAQQQNSSRMLTASTSNSPVWVSSSWTHIGSSSSSERQHWPHVPLFPQTTHMLFSPYWP